MLQPTRRTLMSLAVASACSFMTLSAQAQAVTATAAETQAGAGAPAAPAVANQDQIQEVRVTATRYSTSLLRTPLAVAALSQEQLTRKGATSLSDLSGDTASFGDVVHKSADNSFAEVPWGRSRSINRKSSKPVTLVEALGDIYEVVVLLTGRVGMNSALPMFADLEGRVVLVAGRDDDGDAIADSRAQLLDAGFSSVEVTLGPVRVAA